MSPNTTDLRMGRRRVLQASAVALAGGAALSRAGSAAAQSGTDLTDWFANVSNADGVVDETGASTVTISVGAEGNGGGFAFGPAAVRVDPGTEVVWEWTGKGGQHNVVAEDGSFESDLLGNEGATFEHTFDAEGVFTYACVPHKAMGMKGAVIVGDAEVTVSGGGSGGSGAGGGGGDTESREYLAEEPEYGGWFDDVDTFEGTVDMRGEDEVRIAVGADGNGGGLAFDPPAVAVDPGTDVVWEWVGEDGPHHIVAENGDYESPEQDRGKWGLTLDGVGITKYACSAHRDQGMKGAVVVGDPYASVYDVGTSELAIGGSLGAALLSPVAFGVALWLRDRLGPDEVPAGSDDPADGVGHRRPGAD